MGTGVEPIVYALITTPEEEEMVRQWCKDHPYNDGLDGQPTNVNIDPMTFQPYITVEGKNYLLQFEVNHKGEGMIGGAIFSA